MHARCRSLAEASFSNIRWLLQVLLAGGSDLNGNGLPYSRLLQNLFVGVQASYVQENMAGATRIEGVGILLPDGTAFFCSGGAQGESHGCRHSQHARCARCTCCWLHACTCGVCCPQEAPPLIFIFMPAGFDGGGGFGYGNTFTSFTTAPQIYNPALPIGSRWSGLLADSGIQRGYHNSAVLIASGEVGGSAAPIPERTHARLACTEKSKCCTWAAGRSWWPAQRQQGSGGCSTMCRPTS
jgi:hypothetical protein